MASDGKHEQGLPFAEAADGERTRHLAPAFMTATALVEAMGFKTMAVSGSVFVEFADRTAGHWPVVVAARKCRCLPPLRLYVKAGANMVYPDAVKSGDDIKCIPSSRPKPSGARRSGGTFSPRFTADC